MTESDARRLLALGREAELTGAEADAWVGRLRPEREALQAAVTWLAANGEAGEAVELAVGVWRLWLLEGDVGGGRALLAAALGADGVPSAARARALYAAGLLAFRAGEQEESRTRNEQALALARELGDPEAEALALVGLSRVAFREGDFVRVRELAAQARVLVRGRDSSADVAPLHMLAAGTRLSGDYEQAEALYLESLDLNRGLGDGYMRSVELHNLGHVSLHRGDLDAARRYFAECSAERKVSTQRNPYDTAMEALNDAALAHHRGNRARAASLLAEVERTLDDAGISLDPDDRFEVDWLRDRLAER